MRAKAPENGSNLPYQRKPLTRSKVSKKLTIIKPYSNRKLEDFLPQLDDRKV
jgi:hypothetical protein